jgi:hypothetical protein
MNPDTSRKAHPMSEVNDVVADLRALADAGFGAGHYGPAMKRGADLIAQQAARLEEVERSRDHWLRETQRVLSAGQDAVDALTAAEAEKEELLAALQAADATLTGRDAFALDPIVGSDNPHEHAAGLVRAALPKKEQTDV